MIFGTIIYVHANKLVDFGSGLSPPPSFYKREISLKKEKKEVKILYRY